MDDVNKGTLIQNPSNPNAPRAFTVDNGTKLGIELYGQTLTASLSRWFEAGDIHFRNEEDVGPKYSEEIEYIYKYIETDPILIEYYDCSCYSADHTIRYTYVPELDPSDSTLYVDVQLNQWRNWFKRVWVAIKYVFGYKCKYGHWDCALITKEDAKRLIKLLEKYAKE